MAESKGKDSTTMCQKKKRFKWLPTYRKPMKPTKKQKRRSDVDKEKREPASQTRHKTFELLLWRAWSVLFFDFLPGILCFFFPVFCFVLVLVPVKRTPRIIQAKGLESFTRFLSLLVFVFELCRRIPRIYILYYTSIEWFDWLGDCFEDVHFDFDVHFNFNQLVNSFLRYWFFKILLLCWFLFLL